MARVKVRVAKNFDNTTLSAGVAGNARQNEAEKHTFWEIVQAVFRGLGMLLACFLTYNFGLLVAAALGVGLFGLFDRLCERLSMISITDVFRDVFAWAQDHAALSVTVLVVLYVLGFLWFIYKFVVYMAEAICEQEGTD